MNDHRPPGLRWYRIPKQEPLTAAQIAPLVVRLGPGWKACTQVLPWEDIDGKLRYEVYSPAYAGGLFICRFQLFSPARWWHTGQQMGISGVTHWRLVGDAEPDYAELSGPLMVSRANAVAVLRLRLWWAGFRKYKGLDPEEHSTERNPTMINPNHPSPPLTDAQIRAGARPGESWEQARRRLTEAPARSGLSGFEWQRFVDLVDAIRQHCIQWLHDGRGRDVELLRAQVQHLFEYCCALEDGRAVELLPVERIRDGLFDEAYLLLSRLYPEEAEGLPQCFIGLLDVVSHPEPYENLLNLEDDGTLRMVLNG